MKKEASINITLAGNKLKKIRIYFKNEWYKELKIDKNRKVLFIYNDKIDRTKIIIKKAFYNKTIEKTEKSELYRDFELLAVIGDDNRVLFPKQFLRLFETLGFNKNFKCHYEIKEEELRLTLPNVKKNRKNIILFKINKGGVGKTFLTSQVGIGLTLADPDKKVLIITSDSQNNILNFLDKNDTDVTNGLIKDVLYNKGEYIELRKNLFFLPLENVNFGKIFLKKLKGWLDIKKAEYDYILIDSIPTMKIDEEFVKLADHFVIPAYFDEATIQGIINLITEIDKSKIIAIQGNKYNNRKIENKYKDRLEAVIRETNIMMNEPIPDLSFILTMLDNKKSIFEYSNSKIIPVQKIFVKLIQKIIEVVNNG